MYLILLTMLFTGCLPEFPFEKLFLEDPKTDFDGDGFTVDDCDDDNDSVYPGADEFCDGLDNDCDDSIDENAVDLQIWYADSDGDGYGLDAYSIESCEQPEGYVSAKIGDDGSLLFDCDDTISSIHPGAGETCGDADEDCDGFVNEEDMSEEPPVWYLDLDGDGFGDDVNAQSSCERPSPDYVLEGGDCDDFNASVNPQREEYCDGVDNDCNGLIDDEDDIVDGFWFKDEDNDGFGTNDLSEPAIQQCTQPIGYSLQANDCDDNNPFVSPIGLEVCDELDNDCDGDVDEGVQRFFYLDVDGDQFGRYYDLNGDGLPDDDDGDGLPDNYVEACTAPIDPTTGNLYVSNYTDCDDTRDNVNPAAGEVCDGLDNNCNGQIDIDAGTNAPYWFKDADGDGYGDPAQIIYSCSQPASFVYNDDDCDDGRATVNPDAEESCYTIYNDDCDFLSNGLPNTNDVGAIGCITYYQDEDDDSYGSNVGSCICQPSETFVSLDNTDCNDTNPLINPSQLENCYTLEDDNCNTVTNEQGAIGCSNFYFDNDADGYGVDLNNVCTCIPSGGYTALQGGDCLDSNNVVNPAAEEVCDGFDNNCDGLTDLGDATGALEWHIDQDGDGYGDPNSIVLGNGITSPVLQCFAPTSDYLINSLDCNDLVGSINPAATETCFTLYDDDCDGSVNLTDADGCEIFFKDEDGDGVGSTETLCTCIATTEYPTEIDGDCNDLEPNVSPLAQEICDSNLIDEDCDGNVNEADALGCTYYYTDFDGDGYGVGLPSCLCSPFGLFTSTELGDCDDENGNISQAQGNCSLSGEILLSSASHTLNSSSRLVDQRGMDLNNDGMADLLLAAPYDSSDGVNLGGLYVFYGPFDTTLSATDIGNADLYIEPDSSALDNTQLGVSLLVGQFDGDSLNTPDVLLGSSSNRYLFPNLSGTGTIEWDPLMIQNTVDDPASNEDFVWVGDVDNDGFDNAVYLTSTLSELWDGNINFASSGLMKEAENFPAGVVSPNDFWDLDGDGIQDLLVNDNGQGSVIFGDSNMIGQADITLGTVNGILPVMDFDGDGRSDIVHFDPNFESVKTEPSIGNFIATQLGRVELLRFNNGNIVSELSILGVYHSSESTSIHYSPEQSGFGHGVVSLRDIDGDGKGDLAIQNGTNMDYWGDANCTQNWSLFLGGTPSGTHEVWSMYAYLHDDVFSPVPCGTAPDVLQALGDVNGDGYDDILFADGIISNDGSVWDGGLILLGGL